MRDRVFGCIFDDLHGLRSRDEIGMGQIVFEMDYPHPNGSWPNSRTVAHRLASAAGLDADECRLLVRGNAIRAYGLLHEDAVPGMTVAMLVSRTNDTSVPSMNTLIMPHGRTDSTARNTMLSPGGTRPKCSDAVR